MLYWISCGYPLLFFSRYERENELGTCLVGCGSRNDITFCTRLFGINRGSGGTADVLFFTGFTSRLNGWMSVRYPLILWELCDCAPRWIDWLSTNGCTRPVRFVSSASHEMRPSFCDVKKENRLGLVLIRLALERCYLLYPLIRNLPGKRCRNRWRFIFCRVYFPCKRTNVRAVSFSRLRTPDFLAFSPVFSIELLVNWSL